MPHPIPNEEAAAAPNGAVHEKRDAIDIVADAYNATMSDPVVSTSHEAAKHILDALAATGHGRLQWAEWDEINDALHALGVTATTIEMVGRGSVDSVHAETLDEVFDHLARDIEKQIGNIRTLIGTPSKGKEVQP